MSGPPTTDVGFVQQGQIDWVAFSKTPIPLTVEILARFQSAGVQEITYAGILQLTTRFNLPSLCRQRIWDAIVKLRVYSSAANLLYFGVGHRSFLRFLSESVSGLKCIALCSCLAEMHSQSVAAQVLSALWRELGYPEDFEPSHHQFRALIQACGVALTTSSFPRFAANILLLGLKKPTVYPRCAEPIDIAKALHGLFDVSLGTRDSITVLGGPECGFIAAVAHWVLGLQIYVEDIDGQHVFSSSVATHSNQQTTTQVCVRFVDDAKDCKLVVSRSTFVLRDPQAIFTTSAGAERLLSLRQRIPWSRCLQFVFGQKFKDFCCLRTTVANLFGSVARIYLALADGEVDVGEYSRGNFVGFVAGGYGTGFLESLQNILPEIAALNLRQEMDRVLPQSFQKAQALLEESLLSLQRSCQCHQCLDAGIPNSRAGRQSRQGCLRALAVFIVALVRTVSAAHFGSDSMLDATSQGLLDFLASLIFGHESSTGELLCLSTKTFYAYFPPHLDNIMGHIILLFTGREPQFILERKDNIDPKCTALYQDGLCFYLEGLVCMTTRAESLRRVHILPGRIAWARSGNPQEYDSVTDISHFPDATPTIGNVQTLVGTQEEGSRNQNEIVKGDLTAAVVESEKTRGLGFYYRIATPYGNVIVQPGKLTEQVLAKTGLVGCDKSRCSSTIQDSMALYRVEDGWIIGPPQEDSLPDSVFVDWTNLRTSDVGKLAAFAAQEFVKIGESINETILRRHECLPCCVAAAVHLNASRKEEFSEFPGRLIWHII